MGSRTKVPHTGRHVAKVRRWEILDKSGLTNVGSLLYGTEMVVQWTCELVLRCRFIGAAGAIKLPEQ
jgi:hypothetical protein